MYALNLLPRVQISFAPFWKRTLYSKKQKLISRDCSGLKYQY